MSKDKKPDCVKCGWRPIIPDNFEVMEIIFNYANLFVDGMGGLSSIGIDKVLEWESVVDQKQKSKMISKIILYMSAYMSAQREDG